MSQFWSDVVHRLTPYVPGEQPKGGQQVIKLNTNENPFAPSPTVLYAIADELQLSQQNARELGNRLRLYPDPSASQLKKTIADYHRVSDQQVFVGNGSDEVLAHVFMALLNHDRPLLLPDITYNFYPVYARLYQISTRTIPLAADFTLQLDQYDQPCGAIIFANPSSPTGRLVSLEAITALLRRLPTVPVVIDEAYIDFSGHSQDPDSIATAIPLVALFPNLLVVRTLSKSHSLAGMRVGYAIGQKALIEGLERVKDSFNSYPLDRLAIVAGSAALKDRDYFLRARQVIIQNREAMAQELAVMGFDVVPSAANFIFIRHPQLSAADIAARLRDVHIIVRHFSAPRINNYCRITIGSDVECLALVTALRGIVGQG